MAESKLCSKCGARKDLTEFSAGKGQFGKTTWCKECHLQYAREWRKRNPGKTPEYNDSRKEYRQKRYQENKGRIKEYNRDYALRRKYGITVEDYENILESQGGRCYLCDQYNGDKRLAVDHCHKTNSVRSLLCDLCNRGLGLFRDDPDLLEAAAKYLRVHGG